MLTHGIEFPANLTYDKNMNNFLRLFILGLILSAVAFIAYLIIRPNKPQLDAGSYEECTRVSGAKTLLSDPPKCITPDGTVFIQE